jgi:hypothetical protein
VVAIASITPAFLPPFSSDGNIFPIDPGISLALTQSLMQRANKLFVFTGIGNKNIRHTALQNSPALESIPG